MRYKGTTSLVVRSANVDQIKSAIQKADSLLEQGVSLSDADYGDRTQFLFTEINSTKPDMIREATANARIAAGKFAQDSSTRVGAIRRATQGVLEIEDRDTASPERKVLRVVTTVDFFVESAHVQKPTQEPRSRTKLSPRQGKSRRGRSGDC